MAFKDLRQIHRRLCRDDRRRSGYCAFRGAFHLASEIRFGFCRHRGGKQVFERAFAGRDPHSHFHLLHFHMDYLEEYYLNKYTDHLKLLIMRVIINSDNFLFLLYNKFSGVL